MMDSHVPYLPSPPDSPPTDSPLAAYAYEGMPSAHTVLVLEPDNVRNAVLRHPVSGRSVYTIKSDERGDRTDVRLTDARDSTSTSSSVKTSSPALASIHRKAFSPSVTLNGTRISIGRWLKPSMSGSTFGVSFESNGRFYEWRTNALGNLTLYHEGDKYPIASFTRSRRNSGPSKAYLALEEEAEDMSDDVITSFLIVEETLRMTQRKYEY